MNGCEDMKPRAGSTCAVGGNITLFSRYAIHAALEDWAGQGNYWESLLF